jgi:hypothetical protein
MAGVRSHEGFVKNQRGIVEARVEVAVGPLVGRLPIGSRPSLAFGEIRSVHLSSRWSGLAWWRSRSGRTTQMFPSVRGLGPPGRRVSSGSITNGSGSNQYGSFRLHLRQ